MSICFIMLTFDFCLVLLTSKESVRKRGIEKTNSKTLLLNEITFWQKIDFSESLHIVWSFHCYCYSPIILGRIPGHEFEVVANFIIRIIPFFRCFGLLICPGKNVRYSDMHLLSEASCNNLFLQSKMKHLRGHELVRTEESWSKLCQDLILSPRQSLRYHVYVYNVGILTYYQTIYWDLQLLDCWLFIWPLYCSQCHHKVSAFETIIMWSKQTQRMFLLLEFKKIQ